MSLVLRNWEPFNLFKEFDNVLRNRVQDGIWSPKVNIVENEKGYTISAELPGVDDQQPRAVGHEREAPGNRQRVGVDTVKWIQ